MRIVKQDLKNGEVTVSPARPEDLWQLSKVISAGDLVTARTLRKAAVKRGTEVERGERTPVTLTVRVEKVEFHSHTGALRLTGEIVAGPERAGRGYHTIQPELEEPLTIVKKRWPAHALERLRKAAVAKPLLFICTIDRDEAAFAELRESGVTEQGGVRFRKRGGGKEEGGREEYWDEILAHLRGTEAALLLVAGPGFEKENLLAYAKERAPALAKRVVLERCSEVGLPGVEEVLKRSGQKLLRESRVAAETEAVERLLAELAKEGKAVYGKKETAAAVEAGAVELLLVTEERVAEFEELVESAEQKGAKLVLVSKEHEAGEKLDGLGGVAALLRYKL